MQNKESSRKNDDNNLIVNKTREVLKVNNLNNLLNEDITLCLKQQRSNNADSIFLKNVCVALALNIARNRNTQNYDREKLLSYMPSIRKLSTKQESFFYGELVNTLGDCGISFVLFMKETSL